MQAKVSAKKNYEVEIEDDRDSYKSQDDLELSPGRQALIEGMKDARDFKNKEEEKDSDEEYKDTVGGDIPKKKKERQPRTKEEFERQMAEEKRKLDEELSRLWEESKADPYRKLELNKGDGKIQAEEEGKAGEKKQVKYRYFIRKRKPMGEFKKYFREFDWKEKGVVRQRF